MTGGYFLFPPPPGRLAGIDDNSTSNAEGEPIGLAFCVYIGFKDRPDQEELPRRQSRTAPYGARPVGRRAAYHAKCAKALLASAMRWVSSRFFMAAPSLR